MRLINQRLNHLHPNQDQEKESSINIDAEPF